MSTNFVNQAGDQPVETKLHEPSFEMVYNKRPPSILVVLLRRRRRAGQTELLWLLDKWDLRARYLRLWLLASIPGCSHTTSLVIVSSPPIIIAFILGLGAGSWASPTLPAWETSLFASLVTGLITGSSEWRRVGNFPLRELSHTSPVTNDRLVRTSMVAGLVHHLPTAALLAGLGWGWLDNISDPRSQIRAFILSALILATFVVTHISGCTFRVRLAERRLHTPFSLVIIVVRAIFLIVVFCFTYHIIRIVITIPLGIIVSTFTTTEELLDDSSWSNLGDRILRAYAPDIRNVLSILSHWAPPFISTFIMIAALCAIFSYIKPPLLFAGQNSPRKPTWGKAVTRWSSLQFAGCPKHFTLQRTLFFRRSQQQPWISAHLLGRTLLPPAESLAILAFTAALMNGERSPSTMAAVMLMGSLMAGHALVTDLRIESLPQYSLAHDRDVVPLLLQSRSPRVLVEMTKERVSALRRHAFLPTLFLTTLAMGVAFYSSFDPFISIACGAMVALAVWAGSMLQWYTTPLLLSEAFSLRIEESDGGGLSAKIQDEGQGLPRIFIVVIPSFICFFAYIAPILISGNIAIMAIIFSTIGHFIIYPLAAFSSRNLSRVALSAGLDGWRPR